MKTLQLPVECYNLKNFICILGITIKRMFGRRKIGNEKNQIHAENILNPRVHCVIKRLDVSNIRYVYLNEFSVDGYLIKPLSVAIRFEL